MKVIVKNALNGTGWGYRNGKWGYLVDSDIEKYRRDHWLVDEKNISRANALTDGEGCAPYLPGLMEEEEE